MRFRSLARLIVWFAFSAVVLGYIVLDLNRGAWLATKMSSIPRRDPMFTVMFLAPRWELTLILAATAAWLVDRSTLDASELRLGAALLAIFVLLPTVVVGFVYVSEYPDMFRLPAWWFVVWVFWIVALLVYAVSGGSKDFEDLES